MIERILELMDKHEVIASKLTSETGLPSTAITEWKKGKSRPSRTSLTKVAKYFNVSVDYLQGKTDDPNTEGFSDVGLSIEEAYIVNVFRKGNVRDRAKITNFVFAVEDEINSRNESVG